MKNINKYFKFISSTVIVGAFLFLAFGSDESKDKGSSSSSVDELHTAPSGYKKGPRCSDCSGTGKTVYYSTGTEGVCPGCNGKGYTWVKD